MFLRSGYGNTGDLDTNLPHTVEILFRLSCRSREFRRSTFLKQPKPPEPPTLALPGRFVPSQDPMANWLGIASIPSYPTMRSDIKSYP